MRFAWDLDELKAAGFTVVVSFECELLEPEHVQEMRARGIEHKAMCVPDFTAPKIDQLFEFNEFVDAKLEERKKVLAHCYAGRGRTGTFLASRLIWTGRPVEAAVAAVRAKIHETQGTSAGAIEPTQLESLHHFARLVRDRGAARRA